MIAEVYQKSHYYAQPDFETVVNLEYGNEHCYLCGEPLNMKDALDQDGLIAHCDCGAEYYVPVGALDDEETRIDIQIDKIREGL